MSAMAIARRAFSRALGEGAYDAFRSLNVSDSDFNSIRKQFGLRAGQSFRDEDHGKTYRIIRARGALDEGALLKLYFGAAGRIGTASATNSTKAVLETSDTLVANDLINGEVVVDDTGSGAQEVRYILENDATASNSLVTVAVKDTSYPGSHTAVDSPDAFTTAPDGSSKYSLVCNWEYVETAAVTDAVKAVALGSVTSGNWTIVQESGLALALLDGTTDVTAGDFLVPSATAGVAEAFLPAATPTQANVRAAARVFGQALDAYPTDSAALRHIDLWGIRANY